MSTPPPAPPPPPAVSIRYRLTKGDLFRWQVYIILRNRVLLGFFLLCIAFFVLLTLQQPEIAARSLRFKCFFAVFFSLFFGGAVFLLSLVPLALLVWVRKHRGLVGEHTLEITEAGVVERTDVNESLHRWAGFHKLVSTRHYFYIFVTDVMVHIVPKRFFVTDAEALAFQAAIQQRGKPV